MENEGLPPEKRLSIMDQRRLQEEIEQAKIAAEFANPRWFEIWDSEFPPSFDKLCSAPILHKLVDENLLPSSGRCLVPGCGRGYDVTLIASATRYCLGVDLVPAAITYARERMEQQYEMAMHLQVAAKPPLGQAEFKIFNFFDLDTEHPENLFDFVYDHTFLSSLDPRIHKSWANKVAQLVKVGGELMTVIWPIMEKVAGPPFEMSISMVRDLLMPVGFEVFELYILPPELCHPGRDGTGANNSPRTALGRWRRIQRDLDYDHDFDS